ncbi:uncharacterized protein SPSK_08551 [Sporothrix schenckii 1099-18]|uniref:Uncharacterized protein n=2 Tax=Sporothrix schenckii TaxID=29908 RepID=U7PZR5_SPOS1|nr:uncharacterized protein SPSK_08551 [Sporothrix schenckii 1099-18]ERS99950.1 hypothetical protein HMPREF1624_03319 [Sporothrix schenckii ATCC 58251]KJR85642.1 hypothetical protein SPSK_08551 [Sporothrix schenckii 1099-18]
MIHQHYDPNQILWFLRNYWKFSREGMVEEWHRVFKDSNFAKSQYQWLKSRYGMKEEWGASLNHPPFSGAKPGAPGTENYEPPSVPQHPPRVTFRTRADSPTPRLVTAPAAAFSQTPAPGAPATGSHNHGGMPFAQTPGMPAFAANYQNMMGLAMPSSASPPVQTSMATPAPTPTMPATGAGAYNPNSANSTTGANTVRTAARNMGSGVNGANGTYSFANLGSPFTSNAVGMPNNTTNPIASVFAQGNNPGGDPNAGMFSMSTTDQSGQNMTTPQETWSVPQFQPSYQAFSHMSGDFANSNSAGLGIHHGAPMAIFQGAHMMHAHGTAPYFHNAVPASLPMATSASMPSISTTTGHVEGQPGGRRTSAPIISNANIIADVMRKHNHPNTSPVAATAVSQETSSPTSTGSKRKRSTVEVEFNPPKRAMLAASPDQTGAEIQAIAAPHPSGLSSALASGKAKKTRRKKTTSPSMDSPQAASNVSEDESRPSQIISYSSPSVSDSPSAASACAISPSEIWHDGTHGSCRINGPHRHQGATGIFFEKLEDFEKAATTCSITSAMAALPTPAIPNQATAKAFDLVSRETDVNMAGTEELQVSSQALLQARVQAPIQAPREVPAQVQQAQELPPAPIQGSVPTQAVPPKEMPAVTHTQADSPSQAPVLAPLESSMEESSIAAPDAGPDGSREAAGTEPSVEQLILTRIASSLRENSNTTGTTVAPVTTVNPALSSAQVVPLGIPSTHPLAAVCHNVMPPKSATHVPSLLDATFTAPSVDLESFGFDNTSITEAYFSGMLSSNSENDDVFDMIDQSQF